MQYGNEGEIKTNSNVVTEDEFGNHSPFQEFQNTPNKKNHPLYNILHEIFVNLQSIQEYLKSKEEDGATQGEWSLLAVMLDRLMMVLYLVITSVVTLSLLIPVIL